MAHGGFRTRKKLLGNPLQISPALLSNIEVLIPCHLCAFNTMKFANLYLVQFQNLLHIQSLTNLGII